MTANEYQLLALKTANQKLSLDEQLLEGLMGLNGEAGEAIDIYKKHLFQGHYLNTFHLIKELGDATWYIALIAHAIGYTLEEVFQFNIEKLKERYPDGFNPELSIKRNENDI